MSRMAPAIAPRTPSSPRVWAYRLWACGMYSSGSFDCVSPGRWMTHVPGPVPTSGDCLKSSSAIRTKTRRFSWPPAAMRWRSNGASATTTARRPSAAAARIATDPRVSVAPTSSARMRERVPWRRSASNSARTAVTPRASQPAREPEIRATTPRIASSPMTATRPRRVSQSTPAIGTTASNVATVSTVDGFPNDRLSKLGRSGGTARCPMAPHHVIQWPTLATMYAPETATNRAPDRTTRRVRKNSRASSWTRSRYRPARSTA